MVRPRLVDASGNVLGYISRIQLVSGITHSWDAERPNELELTGEGGVGGSHPDLATHNTLGLATQGELDAHEAAPDPHTGYALASELSDHEGAGDPHTGYQLESAKGVANGYASLDSGGKIPDSEIPSTIARDSELPDLAGHVAAPDPHTQYALDTDLTAHIDDSSAAHAASAISIVDAAGDFTATEVEGALAELQADAEAHVAASDPHTVYQRESEKAAASGYASLDASTKVPAAQLIHTGPTLLVAANNSSARDKAVADHLCDGTADEVQVQAACDALTAGGTVILAPGTYNFAAGVVNTSNLLLRIQGYGATINLASGITGFKANQGVVAGVRGVQHVGLRIIGTGAGGTNIGILLEDTNNSTIEHCYISDCLVGFDFHSNASNAFVEGALIDNVLVRSCGTGWRMRTTSGTGSWMQTVARGLKIAACTIGVDLQSGGQLMRSYVQGTTWIDSNQTGWRFDGIVEDSHLICAIEGATGSTGNTGIYVGANASQTEQAWIWAKFTGAIATQLDNTGNKDFLLMVSGTTTSFSTGTARIGYRRHGDSTDRMRLTMPTAGGKIELGDGTTLDVNAYRSAANILKSDDKFDPASLNLQLKAGTPVDGDVVGGAEDGDFIIDSTNKIAYVRVSGVWESVSGAGGSHPDLATHDALGLATDAELTSHTGTADAHHARSHDHSAAGDGQSLAPAGTVRFSGAADTITTTGAITAQAITNAVLRWNGAAGGTLHGIAGGAEGRLVLIENVTTGQNLTLANQSGTETTATNRIIVPDGGDYAMRPGMAVLLSYDNTTQRWRVFMPAASASTPTTTDATAASAGTAGSNYSRSDHRHLGHNQSHAITSGSDHSHSGGTAGRFFRETGATSFAFEAIPFSRGGTIYKSDGIADAALNVIVWRAPFACTVTAVKGYRVGGSGATLNARRNGSSNHLASAVSISSADTWTDGGSVQNTAYAAGDKLEIMVVSASGSPTQLAVQVDFTRP